MRPCRLPAPVLGLAFVAAIPACLATAPLVAPTYPESSRSDVVDNLHGVKVPDPYRWLEDPDSPATRLWIEEQNRTTRAWIDAIPERAKIEKRLTELWNYERFGVPTKRGGKLFYTRNDGLQDQPVLYVADAPDGAPRVLVDPNALSKDGTVALTERALTNDGRLLLYALADAGSDWTTLRVRDIGSGRDLDDKIEWVKFSGLAWAPNASGFYYSTYPEHDTTGRVAVKNHRLLYHRLGTPQSQDVVVCAEPAHPDWGFAGTVTKDGEMLVISVWQGTEQKNRIWVRDLRRADAPIVKLLDEFDAEYSFVEKRGDALYFRTDAGAARGRIIAVDRRAPERPRWRTLVPEGADTLESVVLAGGRLIAAYLKDAHSDVRVFGLDGAAVDRIALPGLGTASGFDSDPDDDEVFFAYSTFTAPTEIRRYDARTRVAAVWRAPAVKFRPADYVTEQVFYASKDGTRVPMFLTRRKDFDPSPGTPTLLYGYGGFNIPMTPAFSPAVLVWMEGGGQYAVPCIRGGGEYGREWHEAGTKERKQNVFDDFIAAAEWLVAHGMTSPGKLAIHGRSNGGLLVGACLTQRPDLFGAALPAVGVLDMLRYHRFTIGWAWSSDYGTADDAEAFAYLLRYSPVHNVREGVRYPPTLITTGDHDDRVVPAHSFKFAAALQHASAGPSGSATCGPILIRIETRAGHGAGKPTSMQIDEVADQWAFLARVFGARVASGSAL